jgi:hypothetical protein
MTKNNKYNLTQISKIKQAKIIDCINEWCIKDHIGDDGDEPLPNKIIDFVYEKYGLHSIGTELLIKIMLYEKYIVGIPFENDEHHIEKFEHTTKGLVLYFNGGLEKTIHAKRRKRRLIIIAQIAAIIAGLYYLLEILTALHKMMYH